MIPMPGKIIVKQDGHAPASKGGIIFSDKFKDKDRPMTGRVLAVGVGLPCELSWQEISGKISAAKIGENGSFQNDAVAFVLAEIRELERQSRPVSVKAGDRVVFKVFAGDGIEWTDGSMCRCLTEDDILAVILE